MSRAAEKKQSPSPIRSLPEDVVVDILARVPRCDYPRVSLVSKRFRSLVSSPEIYARRSSLGCTEHCLYVVLHNWADGVNRLYMLRRKGNRRCLVLIPGLPDMPPYGSSVAVGSRIYVFCGMMTSSAFFIDCTSHTVKQLPKMPVPMSNTVADVIGGRIYAFGYHGTDQRSYDMVVFDTETQMWEGPMTVPVMWISRGCLVVMAGKMYMKGIENTFVYDPKESKWETDEVLHSKDWGAACVVDHVLYFYDHPDKELRAYDPVHKCWGVVKGLDDLSAEMRRVDWFWAVTLTSYAGKLVLFIRKQEITEEIEISLERRIVGQIRGKVDQCCDDSLIAGNFLFEKSLDVVL